MDCNEDPKFAGLEAMKAKHASTLRDFRRWAAARDWMAFHQNHYDWWMFPTDEPSGFGLAYTVFDEEIEELKQDTRYMANLVEGAVLLGRSWGWDVTAVAPIPRPDHGQEWQNWPIRLYKATKSMKLFELDEAYRSLRQYGRGLLAQGMSFEYSRDLTWLFL